MIRTVLFLSAATFVAPALAHAQTTSSPISEVVVTASRTPTPASPYSTVTVGEARLSGADGVADALTDVGDIYIQAPGGRSGFGSLFLRGSDPNFTTVLLDGVPLNNPTNTRGGSVNISEIGSAALDRVEVVAGPLSGLYGSGALAGAVNLVVAGGQANPAGRISAGLGTNSDWAISAQMRGPLVGTYGGSLTFEAADDGDTTQGSNFSGQTLTGKVAGLDAADGARLIFRLMRTEADTFPDNSGGPLYATRRQTERREAREGLLGGVLPLVVRDHYRFDLSGSLLNRQDETVSPGVAPSAFDPFGVPAGSDTTTYRRAIVQGVAAFDLADWKAVTGLEAQAEKADSSGFLDFGFPVPSSFEGKRTTLSAFAEAARSGPHWTLNGGLRVDDVEDLDAHVTARAGARYDLGQGWALRASAGMGFKAPSFYALGNPFVGNPDLEPEESQSGEIGVDWTGARAHASLSGFHTRFEGLIDFIPGPVPQLANRNVVISEGVSLNAAWRWTPALVASWQVQYADTTDDQTGQTLLNRPKWRASGNLTWTPAAPLTIALRHVYVGDREDYSTPTGPRTLEAYGAFALDAAWTFQPQTTARLVIDNLLDEEYQAAIGFPAPGARARLSLTRNF
jgi:outer membrane cobalamin receptor